MQAERSTSLTLGPSFPANTPFPSSKFHARVEKAQHRKGKLNTTQRQTLPHTRFSFGTTNPSGFVARLSYTFAARKNQLNAFRAVNTAA
eukprot:scaffold1519_cov166-Amphora_coffeaeformis.AAC.5